MNWLDRIKSALQGQPEDMPEHAMLIDVRSPMEFQSGHVAGAFNLPLETVAARIEQIVPDKSTPIVMYCQAGGRSAMACSILQQLGYNCVANGGGVGGLALRLQRDIRRGGS